MTDSPIISEIELSIIAPMFNEEDNVELLLSTIKDTMRLFSGNWEILFINDGSEDNTFEIAKKLEKQYETLSVISYKTNRGRGYALRKGFDNANGRYIVSIDSDLSYHPDHILLMYSEMKSDNSLDVVIGSPLLAGGKIIGVPIFRVLIAKISNKFFNIFHPKNITASTGILRCYKNEVITSLELKSDDKEIHLEILSKLQMLNYTIKEIPATIIGRKRGKSSFHLSKFIISHLKFSFFERPAIIFLLFSLLSIFSGIVFASKLILDFFEGDLNSQRPLIYATIVLLLAGLQLLIFGILAIQTMELRSEIITIQKQNRDILKK